MIKITTAGRCGVLLENGQYVTGKPGDIFKAKASCEKHLIATGAAEAMQEEEASADEKLDYHKMTVAELRTILEERGIEVGADVKKADLIAALTADDDEL